MPIRGLNVCAHGAGTLPKHGDLQRSRATTTAEGPLVSAPSSLIPPRDSPPRSPDVTLRPFLEPSPISVTVLLRPHVKVHSPPSASGTLPSHRLPTLVPRGSHRRPLGAPRTVPSSLPPCLKPRSAAVCKSLPPTLQRVALHNARIHRLPRF